MDRIIEVLKLSECDAIIIPTELSCYYFSGFSSDYSYIVATKDFINYYTDKRYFEEATERLDCTVKLITPINALEIIREDISGMNLIGIDETKLFYNDYIELISKIKAAKIINIGKFILNVRAVKNAEELLLIEGAVNIADNAYTAILPEIKEGITERELAYMLDNQMMINGADGMAFDTIVGFGENSAFPHWHRSDRKLKCGDNVLMDFGAKYKGYNSDMTRVVSFGKPSEEYRRVYDIVLRANEYAIENIVNNMTAIEADNFARKIIVDNGYGDRFTHSLGHGVGVEIHEYPRLAPTSDAKLIKGMVFSIEPGIYLLGKFGVRIEDLVFLSEKVFNLTTSDKELIVI